MALWPFDLDLGLEPTHILGFRKPVHSHSLFLFLLSWGYGPRLLNCFYLFVFFSLKRTFFCKLESNTFTYLSYGTMV